VLAPDSRRTLLDQLRPPENYRLDAAVGTTFTLDLTAALVPPLAFASFAVRSTTDPIRACLLIGVASGCRPGALLLSGR
jgi:hypothetical protein